jgi:hypothetical protein
MMDDHSNDPFEAPEDLSTAEVEDEEELDDELGGDDFAADLADDEAGI